MTLCYWKENSGIPFYSKYVFYISDSCRLWAAVVSEDTWKSDNLDHYHNYYSLDFTPFGNALALEAMANPQVMVECNIHL